MILSILSDIFLARKNGEQLDKNEIDQNTTFTKQCKMAFIIQQMKFCKIAQILLCPFLLPEKIWEGWEYYLYKRNPALPYLYPKISHF